jgi:hypothetical protein
MQQQQVHQDLEMKMKLKKKTLETHTPPPPQMNSASIFAFSLSSKVQRETDPKFFSSFLLCVCVTKRGERERVETLNLCMNDCVFSAFWD